MRRSISEYAIKAIEYLALSFQYPERFFEISRHVIFNREVVHELARLTPQRKWFTGLKLDTIIDVGAYIGSFAFAMRTMFPEAAIHSFDPMAENIEKISRLMKRDQRFFSYQTALGDRQGSIDFWKSSFPASSSVLEMDEFHKQAFPESSTNEKITVPIARLDDFMPTIQLGDNVLLKIDVQGFELAVLKGAEKTLKQTRHVISEVSYRRLYRDQALFDDVYKFLLQKGFQFGGLFDSLYSPSDGSVLQSDALFFKP